MFSNSSDALSSALPPFDAVVKVAYTATNELASIIQEEIVPAHKVVLCKSPYFRQLIQPTCTGEPSTCQSSTSGPPILLDLDIRALKDGLGAFKACLSYLYGGPLDVSLVDAQSLRYLAKLFELSSLEAEIQSALSVNDKVSDVQQISASMFPHAVLAVSSPCLQNQLSIELTQSFCLQMQSFVAHHQLPQFDGFSGFPTSLPSPSSFPSFDGLAPGLQALTQAFANAISGPSVDTAKQESLHKPELGSPCSSAATNSKDAIPIPSDDEDGWCRNKKYIENTGKGFRCTVCNKVYTRYNSVSYHVTIYHRNPPIRCDVDGCHFATREARYIHFHKYYKHGTPLPDIIDTTTRKCPLGSCGHVSKSPAMVEKHLVRHVAESLQADKNYKCQECGYSTSSQARMLGHIRDHTAGTTLRTVDGMMPMKMIDGLRCFAVDRCASNPDATVDIEGKLQSASGPTSSFSPNKLAFSAESLLS
ncbi:Protein F10B5.3 [Aphelenchoides avenae]|nr:Protein F10B5.3 [Aphelenchus avenae]